MSADRLSYVPSLPRPAATRLAGLALRYAKKRATLARRTTLPARRSELLFEARGAARGAHHDDIGRIVYYANAHEHVAARERPLLLLHGMHLNAGAHDFLHMFDAFRAQRHVYVPDLPGFGESDSTARAYVPELYATAIKQLIELCVSETLASVDVVAVGLTSEYAARAVVALPDMVNTLTLIDPTGFTSEHAESVLERLARNGTTFLPLSVLDRLGLGRLCSGGFASLLSGAAFPKGNPQAAYTRVHCPTQVLHAKARKARFGTLARFVRWREHYQETELDSTSLRDRSAVARMEVEMVGFFGRDAIRANHAELSLRAS